MEPGPLRRWRRLWPLDPDVTFLNHGSFGACPRAVLDAQGRLRDRLEARAGAVPGPGAGGAARRARRAASARSWAPIRTTSPSSRTRRRASTPCSGGWTSGRATRSSPRTTRTTPAGTRSTPWRPAPARGSSWRTLPFPAATPEQVLEAVLVAGGTADAAGARRPRDEPDGARPADRAARRASSQSRGVDALVDGAHAPGMVPLDLRALGAAYYTGNCHKWICAPKGSGFLHVRRDRQKGVRPLVISHGANSRADGPLARSGSSSTGWAPPIPRPT